MFTVSQLVEAVWDGEPPPGVSNALQALVSRLRRVLPDLVESQVSGYRLALGPDAADAVRFESLARRGREELRTDPKAAAVTLREALALWRGPALADVQDAAFAMAAAAPAGVAGPGLGNLTRAWHFLDLATASGVSDTPLQQVRISTARAHILLSDEATRAEGLSVLDQVAVTADTSGLAHQLRSIQAIRQAAT